MSEKSKNNWECEPQTMPQFEKFKDRLKYFGELYGKYDFSTEEIIKKAIPWDKVAWGGTYDEDDPKTKVEYGKDGLKYVYPAYVYYPIVRHKNAKGEMEYFYLKDNAEIKSSKRSLAWSCDLYDADGKVLSIMLQAC